MRRLFAGTTALTLSVGLLLAANTPSRAQTTSPDRPDPRPSPALTAPPLIVSPGAETPITLRAAHVDVETQGSLARTTVELTLYNPNRRILEGTLEFPLAEGQSIGGFALDIGAEMRDAVPVPKPQAQQVFESIERRGVDPGLLEQTGGNHFRLRVYPIPPQGTRRVRLHIDEAMRRQDASWRLQVPVHLLAGATDFSLTVHAQGLDRAPQVIGAFEKLAFKQEGKAQVATVARRDFRPGHGLELRFPIPSALLATAQSGPRATSFVQTFDDERYVLAEIMLPLAPPAARVPRTPPAAIGLLWDASASARHHDRQATFAMLDDYLGRMRDGTVTLRLLRDVGEDGGRFAIRDGDWSALRRTLENVVYDGASNLADWTPDPAINEYLFVGDGVRTLGERAFPDLAAKQTLTAIVPADATADMAYLTAVTASRGGEVIVAGRRGHTTLPAPRPQVLGLEGEGVTDLTTESRIVEDGGLLRVAGRLTAPEGHVRVRLRGRDGKPTVIDVPVSADAPRASRIAGLWANWKIAAYAEDPLRHGAEITRLGRRFGIVTPGTSLLVLEAAADYARFDIPAPASLRAEIDELRGEFRRDELMKRERRIDGVAARFAERLHWWGRTFPKGTPPTPKTDRKVRPGRPVAAAGALAERASPAPMAPPPPAPPPPGEREEALMSADAAASAAPGPAARQRTERDDAAGSGVSIRLQPWEPDSPYARRLRDAKPERIYALYLDERDSHADSTAFYLDVADLLLKQGRRAEGLRVLSNLAELKLENRHVLRVLGYRLMQAEAWAQAAEIFREVLRLADEEPQSHRDLGLALAGTGERQEAIRHLYDVAAREWDSRFSEVELVALNEMNEIIATSAKPLDTGFIDPRLLKNMPLDLRVVLAWDSDNSDMDLWVTDPNGEKCYYGNRNTYQGGLLSDDFTGGYGPEEFVLKDAKPGKYKVEANFFGDRQQIVTGATTLNLRLSTGWGTLRRRDQTVTLRLSGRSETVLVGEFEVK